MKRPVSKYGMLVVMTIALIQGLKSQVPPINGGMEQVVVCTDRTLYVSGEDILFSAMIFGTGDTNDPPLSRILYYELITADGSRVTGGKYLLDNNSGQGCLEIPGETMTGMYYLKVYTRFMRNGDTGNYQYVMLKIINPDRSDVASGNPDRESLSAAIRNPESQGEKILSVILPEERTYQKRESVSIRVEGNIGKGFPGKICLSVIPEMAFEEIKVEKDQAMTLAPETFYYPESRGITLSGRLEDQVTGQPLPGALVNLSVIGDKDFMAVRTGPSGSFIFALPDHTGSRDIFLCIGDIPGTSPVIYIENDFCPRPVNLPSYTFHLTGQELATAYQMAVNHKVGSVFQPRQPEDTTIVRPVLKPFYGEPTEILILENYIDLPTLEEYFNELPVQVKVRKSQGRKEFRFLTTQAEMSIYEPLVLIDWVAVDDIERVLAMSPREVDRIELLNSPYVKGNITYGGIISFVSKNNDFAGIDLPASGTFINYSFLEDCNKPRISVPAAENIPDSRNTVYWEPDLQMNAENQAEISFTAPDTPGQYVILWRGITAEGIIILGKEFITVR